MNIIQSFAQYEEGSPYLRDEKLGKSGIYLSFYSFFLSYLTLKKYYGSVTMYCNKSAYNSIIKYIPYDNILFKENTNNIEFWNKYKVDVIAEQDDDFIHVDSDVFIFGDIFRPFYESSECDIIVQDIIPPDVNFAKNFMYDNKEWLLQNNIFDVHTYDNRCYSCGTIGLRKKHINAYIEKTNKIYGGFNSGKLISEGWIKSMIVEELIMYLTSVENNLKAYEIIPYNEIIKTNNDPRSLGVKYKYTHMWFSSKFVKSNIDLIKNKIKTEFNDYYHIVEEYDKYISGFNIKYLEYHN